MDPKVERVWKAATALANNLAEFDTAEYAGEHIDELDGALDALIPERVEPWTPPVVPDPAANTNRFASGGTVRSRRPWWP